MAISIAQAAKELGISVSLIRHYEKEFDLRLGRTKGGQRVITERDLENLRIIRSYRDQHVPIDEIRRQLTPPPTEVAEAAPDLKEVIGALVARQDELERVVKLQQEAIGQLLGENQQLKLLQERVQLLLEAPRQPDPGVVALAEQVAAMESARAEETRQLRERIEALQAEVADSPEGQSDEQEALQERLAELERAVREQQSQAVTPDPAVGELQQKLQEVEAALAAKARGPGDEVVRGLQRRLLDLEAAFATREETPPARDEDSLLDTLVTVIQQEARRRRPWWRFWG